MSSPPQVQKPEPLEPKAVRVALAQRGWSQAELSKRIKVSLTSTNLAINHGTYPRVVKKIRKILGL